MLPRHGLGFDGRHIPGSIAAWFLVTLVACLAQLVQGGLSAAAAQGEAQGARVALVMGNGAYDSSIGRLKNPVNDAELMADTLRALGFKVRLVTDADQKEMKKAVRDFGADLMAAGSDAIGLFYYAGHGVQVDGVNYLLPVGAQIEKEGDVEIEAVSAQSILAQMEHAPNNIDLVFLDACRNNPMTRSFRSGSRGLARVDAPRGSFVGYSTAPGDVSVDGNGDNSPYTLALAAEMRRPGASIEEVHRSVRIRVLAETNNAQTPWDSSSLTANVVLMPAASAPSATAAPAPTAAPQPAQQPAQQPVEPLQVAAVPDPAEQAAAVVQPVPAAAVTTPSPPAQPEIYAARKNANIRAEPNTGARVLGRLKRDEEIAVTGASADGAWLRVTGSFGTGFVSASLLQRQETQPVVMAPAPAPAPELVLPPANALQLDAALRTDVDRFVANSEKIKTHFRFLAVNGKGDRIGTSTSCKIKKSGWGGFSAEGSCDEGTAREEALRACGSDCRIIYNGANKVGDFEIVWSDVGAATATPTVAATTAEPVAEAPTAETPVADSPAVAASSAALAPSPATPTATAPAASAQGGGSVLVLSESLRRDVERFIENSKEIKTHFRFLAVNGKGDRIGTSTSCKIKKSGWGGFSAEGNCDEGTAREEALRACGSDCRIIYNGANKVGDFELAWQ